MHRFPLLLLLLLPLAGCTVSDDDRDFYYRGWVNPNEQRGHFRDASGPPPLPPGYQADPLYDR